MSWTHTEQQNQIVVDRDHRCITEEDIHPQGLTIMKRNQNAEGVLGQNLLKTSITPMIQRMKAEMKGQRIMI